MTAFFVLYCLVIIIVRLFFGAESYFNNYTGKPTALRYFSKI